MQPVLSTRDPHFPDVQAIMQAGFEARERGRDERLGWFIDSGFYRVFAAVHPDGRVVGMAALMQPAGEPDAWLEYMAVDPTERNLGVGTRIMEYLVRETTAYRGLFFEVQIPGEAVDSETNDYRERRIRFYQRLGARLLDHIPYRMWTTDGGIPMLLMFCPVRSEIMPEIPVLEKRLTHSLQKRGEAYMNLFNPKAQE